MTEPLSYAQLQKNYMSWNYKKLTNDWQLLWRDDLSGLRLEKTTKEGTEVVEIPERLIEQIVFNVMTDRMRGYFEDALENLRFEDFVKRYGVEK